VEVYRRRSPRRRSLGGPAGFALFFELSDPAWFQAGGIALALVMLGALGLLGWGLWHHLILGMPR
jgi:hypothetical protein